MQQLTPVQWHRLRHGTGDRGVDRRGAGPVDADRRVHTPVAPDPAPADDGAVHGEPAGPAGTVAGVDDGERAAGLPAGVPVREVASGTSRAEALDRLSRALRFPAHFGGNLDALADSLREAARTPFTLVWIVDAGMPAIDADRITDVLAFVEEEAAGSEDAIQGRAPARGGVTRPGRPAAAGNDDGAVTGASSPSRPRFRVVVVRP